MSKSQIDASECRMYSFYEITSTRRGRLACPPQKRRRFYSALCSKPWLHRTSMHGLTSRLSCGLAWRTPLHHNVALRRQSPLLFRIPNGRQCVAPQLFLKAQRATQISDQDRKPPSPQKNGEPRKPDEMGSLHFVVRRRLISHHLRFHAHGDATIKQPPRVRMSVCPSSSLRTFSPGP